MTSEGTRTREKIYIIGHKNPDTDSICSAIAYTELKKAVLERKLADGTFEAENPLQEGMPVPIPEYIACRAGIVNEETKYVLSISTWSRHSIRTMCSRRSPIWI